MTALAANKATKRMGVTPAVINYPPSVPVAATSHIFAGALVCASATGFATPGAVATTLTALGVAEEEADNSAGADGAIKVRVRRGAHLFVNDGTNPVTQADLFKNVYIVDDQTVSTLGTGRSIAGKFLGFEGAACIVQVGC